MSLQVTEEHKPIKRTRKELEKPENRRELSSEKDRAIAIYDDYSGGTTNGATKFAKATRFSRQGIYDIINGKAAITTRFVNACAKLGYSPEWIMFGTGEMLLDKKSRVLMTDVVQIKAHVNTLVAQLKAKDSRMEGLEKEIDSLKSDIKDIRKMLSDNKIHYRSH